MVSVPGFLLRRLYIKKSLQNTPEGIRFQLKNSLGSGYAKGMLPVAIDGREYPMSETCFLSDGGETPFSAVSEENTFTLSLNKAITVLVKGVSLGPGQHEVEMGFIVPGLGKLKFDVKDNI